MHDDPSAYVCADCPVWAALEALDRDNYVAWQLFQRLGTRFVVEQRAVGVVLDRLTRDCAPEEFEDTVERLSVLYDVCMPQREGSRGA